MYSNRHLKQACHYGCLESSLCYVTLADTNSFAKKDFIIVKNQSMILNILNVLKFSSDWKYEELFAWIKQTLKANFWGQGEVTEECQATKPQARAILTTKWFVFYLEKNIKPFKN